MHALDYSFMKVDRANGQKTIFYGQGTDSGGGVKSLGLRVEIEKLNRVASSNKFMLTACSLYGHNLTIKLPSEKHMGAGGVKFRNCY